MRTILDFLPARPREATPSELQHELIMLDGGPITLHIPSHSLLAVAVYNSERGEYSLGFIDLSRVYAVRGPSCESVEGDSLVGASRRDVPWTRLRLDYALSLVPFSCGGEQLAHVAAKFAIPSEWAMFDWAKIARIVLDEEAEKYVEYLARARGWDIRRVE